MRLFCFGCFYSALAVAILSPTIGSAQQYRGWEFVGTSSDDKGYYSRVVHRSGDIVDIEGMTNKNTSSTIFRFNCAAWTVFNPSYRRWQQIMPGSMGDTIMKKFC